MMLGIGVCVVLYVLLWLMFHNAAKELQYAENSVITHAVIFFILLGVLGIYACLWWMWCRAVPYFWENGPEHFIRPDYWMFVPGMFLVTWLIRMVKAK